MMKEKNNRICVICGEDYYRRGKRNFKTCSLKCKAKYNTLIQTGKKQKKSGEYKKCEICGKEMYLCPSKLKRTRFCSMECRNKGKYALVGKDNPNWKGGRTKVGEYIYIKSNQHPYRNSGNYMAEHRLVMEKKLGRYLNSNEEVHHKNAIKNDNRIKNLELVIKKAHFGKMKCPYCKKQFKIK